MEPVTGCKTTKQTLQEGSGVEVARGKTVTVGPYCPCLSTCLSCQAGACHWRCQRDRQEGGRNRTSCARSNCVTRSFLASVLVHQRPRPAAVHLRGMFAVAFLHALLTRASRRALAKSSKVGVARLLRPACLSSKSYDAFAGWDQGCLGMKKGEVRKLVIPADEGYGAAGFPAWGIPPGGACNS
jgi:hypothetical protein